MITDLCGVPGNVLIVIPEGFGDSMKEIDLEMLGINTGICIVITGVLMAIAWPLAGAWIREKKVVPPTRREAARDLGLWYLMSVLFFAVVPSVIESYGNTYPISGNTLGYFFFLSAAVLFLVVYHIKSYRKQPSQESGFIVILGMAAIGLAISVIFILCSAIAGSALT